MYFIPLGLYQWIFQICLFFSKSILHKMTFITEIYCESYQMIRLHLISEEILSIMDPNFLHSKYHGMINLFKKYVDLLSIKSKKENCKNNFHAQLKGVLSVLRCIKPRLGCFWSFHGILDFYIYLHFILWNLNFIACWIKYIGIRLINVFQKLMEKFWGHDGNLNWLLF